MLSLEEAKRYFSDDEQRIAKDEKGATNWWWLRSSGDYNDAAAIDNDGTILAYDYYYNVSEVGGVRPALWLNL